MTTLQLKQQNKFLLNQLWRIANPIAAMQKDAEIENYQINGQMLVQLSNDSSWLKQEAQKALDVIKGEEKMKMVYEGKQPDSDTFTYRQLLQALTGIEDKHLDKQVIWWGEERGGTVAKLWQLEEDYLYDDYTYNPRSCFDKDIPLEEQVPDMEDIKEQGTPILSVQ